MDLLADSPSPLNQGNEKNKEGSHHWVPLLFQFYLFAIAPLCFFYFPDFTFATGFLTLLLGLTTRCSFRNLTILDLFFAGWFLLHIITAIVSIDPITSFFHCGKILFFYLCTFILNKSDLNENVIQIAMASALLLMGIDSLSAFMSGMGNPEAWNDTRFTTTIFRIQGTFNNPNIMASYIIFTFGFSFFLPSKIGKTTGFLSLVLLVLTHSRGAVVALLATLLMTAIINSKVRKKAVITLFILLLAGLLAGGYSRMKSLGNGQERGINQRLLYFKSAISALRNLPVTGFGPATFAHTYPRFRQKTGVYTLYTHNEILQQLSEMGLFSLPLLLAIILFLLLRLKQGRFHTPFNQALTFSLVTLFIHNQVSFSFRIYPLTLLAFCSLGLLSQELKAITALFPALKSIIPPTRFSRFLLLPLSIYSALYLTGNYIQYRFIEKLKLGKLSQKEADDMGKLAPWNYFILAHNPYLSTKRLNALLYQKPYEVAVALILIKKLLKKGDYSTVIEIAEKSLIWDPLNEELRFYQAVALVKHNRLHEALNALLTIHHHLGTDYLFIQPLNRPIYKLLIQLLEKLAEDEEDEKKKRTLNNTLLECQAILSRLLNKNESKP